MGNAALDCTGARNSALQSRQEGSNQKGRYVVEFAASVLFGIPPLATAYHTSIVVDGEEYFFSDSGMCADTKLISHQGNPTEKWEAGRTDLSGTDLWRALQDHFRPGTYDLLRKNCNSFTDAAMFFLLGRRLDRRYSEAERIGQNTPDMVRALGMYAPNPVAADFNLEDVIAALSKLQAKPSKASNVVGAPPRLPDEGVHRIPHLPRPSAQRKLALGDITNMQPGPGARANEVEAAMMKKTLSRASEDSTSSSSGGASSGSGGASSSSGGIARRAPPRKFASSNASRRTSSPPRQPASLASTPAPLPVTTPRMGRPDRVRSDSIPRFLTQRVYTSNQKAPGSDLEKENNTPRGASTPRGVTEDKPRSRSKGPITRSGLNIKNSLAALASRGGA